MTRPTTRRRIAVLAIVVLLGVAPGLALGHDELPPTLRGLIPPEGFVLTPWASGIPAPSSLAWGPTQVLYVTALDGNVYAFAPAGSYVAAAGPPRVFASGLTQPLGVVVGADGNVYVSDSYRENGLTWGRVKVFSDPDGDGSAGAGEVVVAGLPNGRHNTNGMAFGPDGFLYVTNGNRTDDGIECGPEPIESRTCPAPEAPPYSGSLLRVDPSKRDQGLSDVQVIAKGFRNIYDVAFWPGDASVAYIPMNGPDDPAADDLLFRTDVDDGVQDNMGFPSCLYNWHLNPLLANQLFPPGQHDVHGENLEPQENPVSEVIDAFGPCPTTTVVRPLASFGGHVSANGLAFAAGSAFPALYQDDLFVAEWGNIWGLEDGHFSGHKIVRVDLGPNGLPVLEEDGHPRVEEFATGGNPLDLVFGPDGAMYVADFDGFIYRIAAAL